jgi:hypothetical protein
MSSSHNILKGVGITYIPNSFEYSLWMHSLLTVFCPCLVCSSVAFPDIYSTLGSRWLLPQSPQLLLIVLPIGMILTNYGIRNHRYDPSKNSYHDDMEGAGVVCLAVDILPTEFSKEVLHPISFLSV